MAQVTSNEHLFIEQNRAIGSTWLGYDTTTNNPAGSDGTGIYYATLTKFKTPSFSGTSSNISLLMYIVGVLGNSPTLRYALCTSDVNKGSYVNTYSAVSDPYQVASGTVTFTNISPSANNYETISIDTSGVKGGETYYLYLWASTPTSNPSFVSVQGSNYHRSITVTYYEPYTLSISQGSGSSISVLRNGSYLSNGATINYGDVLTIYFSANTGYNLNTQTVNGGSFSSGSKHTVTGNVSIVSRASLKTYTLYIDQGAGSSISVKRNGSSLSNGTTISYGDVLNITFSANTGYNLGGCTVNGSSFSSGGNHTVTGNVSVASSASLKTFSLSISQGTGSSISVKRNGSSLGHGATITYGDVLVISFGANTGYNLGAHTVNGSPASSGSSHTVTGSISVVSTASLKTYKLTVGSIGNGSVTINRTYSLGGGTGTIGSGATLYYFDKIKITFSPSSGYKFTATLVNGSAFTSGSSHDVTANVTITATTQALCSTVGATNADIGSTSTITIIRNSSSYTHTLSYSFSGLSGTIVSKTSATSYPWTIPTSFYTKIPNDTYGTCTITCKTYSGNTLLGSSSCSIRVSTSSTNCVPSVSGIVYDSNADTVSLTGNNSSIIRYKSTAVCTISAEAKNSASISVLSINGSSVTANSPTKSFAGVETGNFVFKAVDSRGYSSSETVSPTFVPYVKLTINPVFYRPAPTTGEVALTFNGNYYNGSFGAHDNTITIRYRYRNVQTSSAYDDWVVIDTADYSTGSTTYSTPSAILLDGVFDYTQTYEFQIQAYDGANDIILTSVSVTQQVQRGKPVFDWGEDDFNFNVDVKINGVNIIDIFYPVNTVYLSYNSSLPSIIATLGTWSSIATGISGVYGWRRSS